MSGDSFVANGSALPPAKSGTSRPSRAPALRTLPRRLVRFASPPRLPNNLPPHLRPSLHLPRSLETSKLSGFFKLRPLCFRRRPQEKSSFRDLGAKVFVIVSSKSETPAFQPARGVVQRKTQWAWVEPPANAGLGRALSPPRARNNAPIRPRHPHPHTLCLSPLPPLHSPL